MAYNQDRIWLAQRILTPSRDQPRGSRNTPCSTAGQPLSVVDVMGVLRATYAGTVLAGKADRPIGYEKTAESHIITLDHGMPPELAGLIWQAISTPLGAPYMPLHNVLTDIPSSYTRGANEFTPLSAYWAFHGAHALQVLLERLGHSAKPTWWSEFEKQCIAEAPLLNTMLTNTYRKDSATAIDLAARASAGIASQAFDLATRSTAALLTDVANEAASDHTRATSALAHETASVRPRMTVIPMVMVRVHKASPGRRAALLWGHQSGQLSNSLGVRPNMLATTSFDGSIATTLQAHRHRRRLRQHPGGGVERAWAVVQGQALPLLPRPPRNGPWSAAMVHTIDDDFAAEVARLCATPVSDEPWQAFLDAHVSLDDPGRASR